MTDNTQELDGLLNAYLNACVYSQGTAWEQEEEVKEAKQAILDWHNKQAEKMLDRLESSIDDGKKSHSMAVISDAIEAERAKLKESN